MLLRLVILACCLVWLQSYTISCVSNPKQKTKGTHIVSVMTYNVENLFDTEDDPNIDDETYLPLSLKKSGAPRAKCHSLSTSYYVDECLSLDWNQDMLDTKMKRLSDVVLQVNGGKGPDILILQEVENKNVLDMWNQKFLKKAGYSGAQILEGSDKRGIDVAFLTRLPMVGDLKLHEIDFTIPGDEKSKGYKSRGILQMKVKLPDETIMNVFSVHFPSQASPVAYREKAAAKLNELKKAVPAGELAIAGGDFNVSADEERESKVYSKTLSTEWAVSHLVGCGTCEGTEYYPRKRQWSFFDVLLFQPQFVDGKSAWQLNVDSVQVPSESKYQANRYGTPARFNQGRSKVGVSDHWPMYAEIYKK